MLKDLCQPHLRPGNAPMRPRERKLVRMLAEGLETEQNASAGEEEDEDQDEDWD